MTAPLELRQLPGTKTVVPSGFLTDTSRQRDFYTSDEPSVLGATRAVGDRWFFCPQAPPPPPQPPGWSAANPPWQLGTGETVDDNRPAGVQVLDYSTYSNGGTRSLGATLAAARTVATAPFYLRLPAGTFYFTDFSFAATGPGLGHCYQDINSTKYFAGMIGAGADKTFVVVRPNILTQTQIDGISSGSPNPVQASVIYAGGAGLNAPTFFSGITFRGSFQQSTTLTGLSGNAPAPYAGITPVSVKAGSRIQFCRFQGFAFTAKSSPPYELGAIISSHSSYTVERVEIDGRLAPEIDATQPVSSGGLMWNYETDVKVIDSWQHHTRRSGFAMHDHAPSEGGNASDPGVYYCENFQVERVADTTDSFAGSALGFAPSNVEELRRSFTYVAPRFTASTAKGPQHLNIALSNGNTPADAITISDPVIGNTAFNGCLYINIVITPNSGGADPYYTAWQSSGLGALPITVTAAGRTLTPVLSTGFNAAIHTPDQYFIVRFA